MGKSGLQKRHRLALKLIAEGRLSRTEIAKTCGMAKSTLSNLCSGNCAAGGNLAPAFKSEYQKIAEIPPGDSGDLLLKENKSLALTKLNQRLRSLIPLEPTTEMVHELISILNAHAKLRWEGSVHAHYHLTAEERLNEFRRLIAATAKDSQNQQHKKPGRGA